MENSKPRTRKTSPTRWLIVWWPGATGRGADGSEIHRPSFALFSDFKVAESAAHVRNALLIAYTGTIVDVRDYKYLDDDSEPISGEQRDLQGANFGGATLRTLR